MIKIYSPYSKALVGKLEETSREQLDIALKKAKAAQQKWSKITKHERVSVLNRWAALLRENADELATLIMKEVGKTHSDAKKEVLRSAEYIEYTNTEYLHQEIDAMIGENFSNDYKNKVAMIQRVPLGTILAIGPFNYPVNLTTAKISPGLVTGNAVVFKPSTQGALSGIKAAELLFQAGLDRDLLPIVTGRGSEIGDYLTSHPLIDMISFTGSTSVGKHIADVAGGIPLVLEMGGKDAALVLDRGKLDVAADEIVKGAFSFSAQRCTAIKRVIVLEELYDELCAAILEKISRLETGSPEDGATIVPLISTKSADYVEELIIDAKLKGGAILCGGNRDGNIIEATVITNVTKSMRIYDEEPFGPVLPILIANSVQNAVDLANDCPFGLQCSIFISDMDKGLLISSELDVGSVQINSRTERGPDNLPFLGVKDSGLGVQGVKSSIESMTRLKVTVLNLAANMS